MISEIGIQNFKSISDLTLKPGRVTVLIGENGSGKSNILEGIAFAAGAATRKLDNEFLFNRGIRVTDWKWMQAAFEDGTDAAKETQSLLFRFRDLELNEELKLRIQPKFMEEEFDHWEVERPPEEADLELARMRFSPEERGRILADIIEQASGEKRKTLDALQEKNRELWALAAAALAIHSEREVTFPEKTGLADYLIFAPENTVLRTPPPEGAIEPLGTKGEGLLKLLQTFSDERYANRLTDMKARLHLFGWFDDFLSPDETATARARLQLRDRWLAPDRAIFDQRSANEGFLYVLFYLTLLMSWRTPKFFAIDNIDNALNPKLCSALIGHIADLARKHDKQVICTTHNPAVLDGLDLRQDDERLYTVARDSNGHTTVRRVRAPEPRPGETPVRLSEAFTRGLIGGLPEHF